MQTKRVRIGDTGRGLQIAGKASRILWPNGGLVIAAIWRPPGPRQDEAPETERGTAGEGIGRFPRLAAPPAMTRGDRPPTGSIPFQGYRNLPLPQRLAFRYRTASKEGGTKADGIGDGRVGRGRPSVCKRCGAGEGCDSVGMVNRRFRSGRAAAPDRDAEEKAGTNSAGIGDTAGRQIPFVKASLKPLWRNVAAK